MARGQVKNHSSKTLWVVETDTGPAIAHKLFPGMESPGTVDADGFRAVDGTLVDGHGSWVKINDFSTADVSNNAAELSRGCILCGNVQDNEFGNVTFDQSTEWGVPITSFQSPAMENRAKFAPRDFVSFLQSENIKTSSVVLRGLAKVVEGETESVFFSQSGDCTNWIPIPVEVIDNVEHLGQTKCKDHEHAVVRMFLKPPQENPLASLFAELLCHLQSEHSSFRSDRPLAATQRIDIRFESNGNGTLTCGAGTFACQGQPGRRYPRDITISTSDKRGTHFSNEFQVWMNYSILIWGQVGIYIHEWPYCRATGGTSAGCIHLCPPTAATVYNWIVGRTRVTIDYPW
jgi:hypothetical protein